MFDITATEFALAILFFVPNVFLGAMFGRMDGGGVYKTPEIVERLLIMSYFVLACIPFAGWFSLLSLAGMAGIATGHGQYFLARLIKYVEPEFFDLFVRIFFGADPRSNITFKGRGENDPYIKAAMESYGMVKLYWRCVVGLFVTGSVVGSAAALVAIYFGEYHAAIWFALTGVVKAASYMACYAIWKDTKQAEWCNGGTRTFLALRAFIAGV